MEGKNAVDIFSTMIDEDIVYAFHGDFDYHVINTLLTDIKNELHKAAPNVKTAKKTYKVLVEFANAKVKTSASGKTKKLLGPLSEVKGVGPKIVESAQFLLHENYPELCGIEKKK